MSIIGNWSFDIKDLQEVFEKAKELDAKILSSVIGDDNRIYVTIEYKPQ